MRTSFSKLFLLALPLAALTACQDYEPFDEAEVREALVNREYVENFKSYFGEIDPNHTWGFGPICVLNGETAGASTRGNISNSNQWASLDPSQNYYHLQVPGWPDVYTYSDGSTPSEYLYQYDPNGQHYGAYGNAAAVGTNNPAGDVTDEEVRYVSWWFRTHQWPDSETLHWTDFFIQEISSDGDRDSDGNLIAQIPEYDANGIKNPAQYHTMSDGDWAINQFSMQVFDVNASNNMMPAGQKPDGSGWDHNKNFNKNASNSLLSAVNVYMGEGDLPLNQVSDDPFQELKNNSDESVDTPRRNIAYYSCSGTENFGAHYNSDNIFRDENQYGKPIWVLVHLVFDGEEDPVTHKRRHYDGYYLGFDFMLDKSGDNANNYYKRDADGYFSNWIVKLSPGKPKETWPPTNFTRRVMCEDLGNTYDYDFNDVVFDVTYNVTSTDPSLLTEGVNATIIIQAAGGTMPIYVGVDPTSTGASKYEAHHLLGHNTSTPVNVGGESHAVGIYNLKLHSYDPGDIPIYVVSSGNAATGVTSSIRQLEYKKPNENSSKVPQKFACPNIVQWMKEEQFIDWGYPNFKLWVGNDAGYGESSAEPWFMVTDDNSKIYQWKQIVLPPAGPSGPTGDIYEELGVEITPTEFKQDEYNTNYRLPFTLFDLTPKPDNFELTFVCHPKNPSPGVGSDANLRKALWVNDGGYEQTENGDDNKISPTISSVENGTYYITFVIPSSSLADDIYNYYQINNIYNKGDQVETVRLRAYSGN